MEITLSSCPPRALPDLLVDPVLAFLPNSPTHPLPIVPLSKLGISVALFSRILP